MKYCSMCGNPINEEEQKFCTACGASLQNASADDAEKVQDGTLGSFEGTSLAVGTEKKHPMKWFKFLIWFALFAGAFFEFVFGVNYISGEIYFVQTNGRVTGEFVYSVFETLKIWDVLYGLGLFGMAALNIITRFKLAKYKKDGPKYLYISYIAGVVLSVIYTIGAEIIIGSGGTNYATV